METETPIATIDIDKNLITTTNILIPSLNIPFHKVESDNTTINELCHFMLKKDLFYNSISSFKYDLKISGSEKTGLLHLLVCSDNSLSLFFSDCFFDVTKDQINQTISHPCNLFKSRTILYQALVIEKESKFTQMYQIDVSNNDLNPQTNNIEKFFIDILLSQKDLPITLIRLYLHASI